MPIQIKAPDGSIAQFPDGMADADIEKVMAQHYPQPSTLDRIVGTIGRPIHDIAIRGAEGFAQMVDQAENLIPIVGPVRQASKAVAAMATNSLAPLQPLNFSAIEQPYQNAIARNRNTPGYAAARAQTDTLAQKGGSGGFMDQMVAPFLPTVAGTVGGVVGGSLDSSNAAADSQQAAQDAYASAHPILSRIAGFAGGLLAAPEGGAARLPAYASDNPIVTRAVNPDLMGPLQQGPPVMTVDPAVAHVGKILASTGKTPADLAAFDTGGKPITAAEATGRPGIVDLSALGRREGATPDALQGLLDERSAGAPDRVLADYAQASGIDPHAAQGNIDQLVKTGRVKAGPLYDQAYEQTPVITDRLNQFLKDPIVQRGMKEGIRTEQLKALAAGQPFDPNAYAITSFDAAGDPVIGPVPTWKSWDAAKLGIDDILDSYRDKTTGRLMLDKRGSAISDVRQAMLKEVDALNPQYAAARASAADYLGASDAFRKGQDMILNPNATVAQFQKFMTDQTPGDLEAMKGGAANKLFNLAQNGTLNPKLFNRPIVQQKLSALLGPNQASSLVANVQREAQMAANAGRMRPGAYSPTQELSAAMQAQDTENPAMNFALDAGSNIVQHGPIKGALKTGAQYLKNPIANLRASSMPVPVRDAAGQIWMLPPAEAAQRLQSLPMLPQRMPAPIPAGLLAAPAFQQSNASR